MARAVRIAGPLVALAILAVILYNATLVDRVPPAIERVYLSQPLPGDDHTGQTLTTIDVRFSKPVRTGTVERRFTISPEIAGTWSWEGQRVAIFTPSHKLPPLTKFTVHLASGFEDLVGNVASAGIDSWVFKTVGPPAIVATAPAAGAADVPIDSPLTITFDRLMDTASVATTLRLDPAVPFVIAWSGRVLTLTPSRGLDFATTYALTVGAGAADTDGTSLPQYTLRFTTVPTGLVVLSTVPASNVSGVSVRTPITIDFDAPIDPASIASAIQVTPPVGGDVRILDLPDDSVPAPSPDSSPSPGSGGHILLFSPSQPLAAHTTYTVTLRATVHRLGQPGQVAPGESWTFTTGQAAQSAQNQIAFLSGRSGVVNVWLMNPDGTNARQLTTELVPVSGFDVSGDGASLTYASGGVVKRMRVDGTDLTTLTQAGRFEYAPAFTPDGSGIILGRRDAAGTDLGYWRVPLVPGLQERQLTVDGAPPLGSVSLGADSLLPGTGEPAWARRAAFSADGKTLLLVGGDGAVRLVTLPPASGGPAPAVTRLSLISDTAPAWVSRDAAFYLVARPDATSPSSAWVIRPGGAAPTRLFAATGQVAASVDGDLAALLDNGSSQAQLAFAGGPNHEPVTIAEDSSYAARSPVFAPDGSAILFVRVPAAQQGRSAGIWVVEPDGSGLRQLALDGAYPRWLP